MGADGGQPVPLDLDRVAPEAVPGVRVLPLVHERIELAAVVRAVLDALQPAGVAVELPTTLAAAAARAVARLPRVSVVISLEPGEDALVWAVAPGDPFVEAMRWASERQRPVFCVDPDIPYAEKHADPVPDPYALWSVGAATYLDLLRGGAGVAGDLDRRREAGMAFHLRRAADGLDGPLLVLVGAAHAGGLAERLAGASAHPFARPRRSSVEVRHLHPTSLTGLLPDAPLAHAVWERLRDGSPPEAELQETLSRKVSVVRFGLRVIAGEGGAEEARRRERLVAYAARQGSRPFAGVRPAPDREEADRSRANGRETGRPAVLRRPERWAPDRRALGEVVWRVGAGSYREQTGETPGPWQRRLFFDFARRCARVAGQLVPGLYEWVTAARGVGDDNLAWEVFDAARTYPWQQELAELATARIDGDELDLGTRKIRFRRRFFRVKQRPIAVPLRERPRPRDPAEWLLAFDAEGLCSYPPEDLVIEDYGRFVQKKAVSILSAERRRTEPFTASLLDGIDVRETLRNVHEDRVYVQELGRAPGEAGSVVVIFDRDPENLRFPYAMTWLGESDQESDMALYATHPAEQVVGPGIMRATYGGFMLTQPRGRLSDVWGDPDYRFARDKAEVLLMAAVDYSLEKIVAHVAKEAPREEMRRYAAAQGKRIVHVPLASLSPVTLKKIRVLHVLAGRDKRAIARDYVW